MRRSTCAQTYPKCSSETHSSPRDRPSSAADLTQFTLHVAGHVALADRFALVVEVLALGQGELDLGARPWPRKVHPGRHQRQPTLSRAAEQAVDLLTVQQQLARPLRIVVGIRRRAVRGDVYADQPQLAVA